LTFDLAFFSFFSFFFAKEKEKETDLDNLPNETEDQMGSSGNDVLGVNVDDVAADGTGRVEHEGVVLRDLDRVGGLLVDGALVNGLGDGVVDELAEENSAAAGLEEGVTLLGDGEEVLEVGVVLEGVVDPVNEGELLLVGVGVSGSISGRGGGATHHVDVAGLLDHEAEAAALAAPALSNNLFGTKRRFDLEKIPKPGMTP